MSKQTLDVQLSQLLNAKMLPVLDAHEAGMQGLAGLALHAAQLAHEEGDEAEAQMFQDTYLHFKQSLVRTLEHLKVLQGANVAQFYPALRAVTDDFLHQASAIEIFQSNTKHMLDEEAEEDLDGSIRAWRNSVVQLRSIQAEAQSLYDEAFPLNADRVERLKGIQAEMRTIRTRTQSAAANAHYALQELIKSRNDMARDMRDVDLIEKLDVEAENTNRALWRCPAFSQDTEDLIAHFDRATNLFQLDDYRLQAHAWCNKARDILHQSAMALAQIKAILTVSHQPITENELIDLGVAGEKLQRQRGKIAQYDQFTVAKLTHTMSPSFVKLTGGKDTFASR